MGSGKEISKSENFIVCIPLHVFRAIEHWICPFVKCLFKSSDYFTTGSFAFSLLMYMSSLYVQYESFLQTYILQISSALWVSFPLSKMS